MKRLFILACALTLVMGTMCATQVSALTISSGQSLWVQNNSPAPTWFDGMTLFWQITSAEESSNLDYYLYRYTGTGPEDPDNSIDITSFWSNRVIFEFRCTAGSVTLGDDALVWDPEEVINHKTLPSDAPFKYAFYDLGDSGYFLTRWSNRRAIAYQAGTYSNSTAPTHGDLIFHHPLDLLGGSWDIRSDFDHVPVPASIWLLSSGLLGLWGLRRRRN